MLYQPPSSQPKLGIRIALILAIVIVCYQLYSLAFQIYKDSQIDIQYQAILIENNRLAREREELLQLIAYLQTPGYREKEQKKINNLVKPGEKVLILERPREEGNDNALETEYGSEYTDKWNAKTMPQKWWEYFFDDDEYVNRPID